VPGVEHVYGFQRASASSGYKITMLNRGESPLKGEEPGLEELLGKVVGAGKFSCTADFSKIAECDAVTLAIQTPFADKKDLLPDFSPLIEGLRNVGRHLTPGTLVVLESTITPGTTTGMAREILEEESGLGGHCLTKDTYHLEHGVQVLGREELDFPAGRESLYTLARGINDFMPEHMLRLTESALAQAGKTLKGSKIALLGWAFINDSDDANTPAEPFCDAALAAGAEVAVHDPWVDPGLRPPDAPPGLSRDLAGVLSGADAVVVFAGHSTGDLCRSR